MGMYELANVVDSKMKKLIIHLIFVFIFIRLIINIYKILRLFTIKNMTLNYIIYVIELVYYFFMIFVSNLTIYFKFFLILSQKTIIRSLSLFIFNHIKFHYTPYITWVFYFIPRLIIACIFALDVLYFNKLNISIKYYH